MKNGRNGKRQERKRGNIKVDWDRAEKEMRWVEKEQEKGEREGGRAGGEGGGEALYKAGNKEQRPGDV